MDSTDSGLFSTRYYMKKIYYFEEPSMLNKKNGIVEMVGKANALRDVDAIYTENSGVKHLMDIRDELRMHDLDIPIYVITNPFRQQFLHSLVPTIEVISDENSPEEIAAIIDEDISKPEVERKANFTNKEKQVLEEIGYGLCDKEICASLGMSERTVRRYKTKLLAKTGLMSSGQLALYALSNQFLS